MIGILTMCNKNRENGIRGDLGYPGLDHGVSKMATSGSEGVPYAARLSLKVICF